jgi:hypothetical protein
MKKLSPKNGLTPKIKEVDIFLVDSKTTLWDNGLNQAIKRETKD